MTIDTFYHPERAKKSIPPSTLKDFIEQHKDEDWIAEEKLDGSRYLLYIGEDGCQLRSRRISVKDDLPVEKTDNCPHLCKVYPGMAGTILDGEIKMPGAFSKTVSVMGSAPEKAIAFQEENGWVEYHVFDILFHKGKDVREEKWSDRNMLLKDALKNLQNPSMEYVTQFSMDTWVDRYNTIVLHDGEGLMLKKMDSKYGETWTKVKKVITIDVVITGYTEGGGKYADQIGAVVFGLYKDGELIDVGQCSGMSDEERAYITENQQKLKRTVIEVTGQEFTKGMKLRHPRFIRFRPDKVDTMCNWDEQINQLGAVIDG